MIEGESQIYQMVHVTEEPFRLLVQWFYAQRLNFDPHFKEFKSKDAQLNYDHDGIVCKNEALILFQLWLLADELLMPALQNVVMDQLGVIQGDCILPLYRHLNYVYEESSEDSQLRQYLVARCVWYLEPEQYKLTPELFPKDFLLDLSTTFSSAAPSHVRRSRRGMFDITKFYVDR
jgi:hypothetical protein